MASLKDVTGLSGAAWAAVLGTLATVFLAVQWSEPIALNVVVALVGATVTAVAAVVVFVWGLERRPRCPRCGGRLRADYRVCPYCGSAVPWSTAIIASS